MAESHRDTVRELAGKAFVPHPTKKGRIKVRPKAANRLFKSFEKYTRTAAWKSGHGSGRPNDWEDLSQDCLLALFEMFKKKGSRPYGYDPDVALKLKVKNRLTNSFREWKVGGIHHVPTDFGPAPDHDMQLVASVIPADVQVAQRETLDRALSCLSPTERRFINVWLEKDGVILHVAEQLGLKTETCRRFQARTFVKMRSALA